jgi:hypothetical protein
MLEVCPDYGVTLRVLFWKAPALPENIRLRWKGLTVTSTLAYHDLELITVVKSFNCGQIYESIYRVKQH